jgi:hypothetical protein
MTRLPTSRSPAGLEAWITARLELIALVIIGVGFAIRLLLAINSFLNPDEIIHFMTADQSSLAKACEESIGCQHPPLHYVFLYFWRFFGRSDFLLRLPSLLMGTALLWIVFKWLSLIFSPAAGLLGLGMMTFSPEIVLLSTEVRGYVILLLLVFSAFDCLERSLREQTPRMMAFFSVLLVLAILTDYSAVWLALVLGFYVLVRVLRKELSANNRYMWFGGQAAVAVVGLVLFQAQIPAFRQSGAQQFARESWLRASYFHPGADNLLLFLARNTVAVFQFLLSSRVLGIAALLLFVVAVIWLFLTRSSRLALAGKSEPPANQDYALLIALPFVVAAGLALTGLVPYGGTRHSLLPAVFGFVGLSFILAQFMRHRLAPALLATAVLGPIWTFTAHTAPDWYIAPRDQRSSLMWEAMAYVRQVTPANGFVFSDDQSQVLLTRYLCGGKQRAAQLHPRGFIEFDCEGSTGVPPVPRFRLVSPETWTFKVGDTSDVFNRDFGQEFVRFREGYVVKPGDTVCVVSAGWGENLVAKLARQHIRYPGLRTFGNHIAVFLVPVGAELGMEVPARRLAQTQHSLDSLARAMARRLPLQLRTVFWPTYYLTDSTARVTGDLASQVVSYQELYRVLAQGSARLDRYLPGLAFWVFNTPELHIKLTGIMDQGESYQAANCRFTLLATDPNERVGVFAVESDLPRVPE